MPESEEPRLFLAKDLGCRVWGSGFRGLGFGGSGFRGLGFRV